MCVGETSPMHIPHPHSADPLAGLVLAWSGLVRVCIRHSLLSPHTISASPHDENQHSVMVPFVAKCESLDVSFVVATLNRLTAVHIE